mgnify:FL=1
MDNHRHNYGKHGNYQCKCGKWKHIGKGHGELGDGMDFLRNQLTGVFSPRKRS